MLRNCELPPVTWAPMLIGTLLPHGAATELADELAAMIADFHPAATRTALQAFAEADLSDALADIDVPSLLLCAQRDVRAAQHVWEPCTRGSRTPAW